MVRRCIGSRGRLDQLQDIAFRIHAVAMDAATERPLGLRRVDGTSELGENGASFLEAVDTERQLDGSVLSTRKVGSKE